MQTVIELRAERARLVAAMDHIYDRMNCGNMPSLAAELNRLATIVNGIDRMLIGAPST